MFTALFSGMINFKHIYKNRLFIIGLHIVAWTCFLLLPFFIYRLRILHPWFFIREVIDNLFLIGVFYLNIYVLIPRFFTLKKIVYYFGCVLVVLVFITIQQAVMDHYFMRYLARHESELGLNGAIAERGGRMITIDSTGKVTFRGPRAFMRYRAFSSANGGIYAYTKGRPVGRDEIRFMGGPGHGPHLLIRNDSSSHCHGDAGYAAGATAFLAADAVPGSAPEVSAGRLVNAADERVHQDSAGVVQE